MYRVVYLLYYLMSGVMLDLVAVILGGLRPHGGFGMSQIKQWVVFRDLLFCD